MSPLPINPKQPWPPREVPTADFALWDSWYSGRFGRLATATAGFEEFLRDGHAPTTTSLPERLTGGFVHRHAPSAGRTASQPLHCPLAGDIAQVSADLLFGDMPSVQLPEGESQEKAQTRLSEVLEAMGIQNTLLEAAEPCAALGGSYLRVVWDKELLDHPLVTCVDADRAVPEFRLGMLTAVTFWHEVSGETQKGVVLRHLERYEPGRILHGLYRGDATLLGHSIPLEGSPDTEGLIPEIALPAGLPHDMAAFYVPNVRPNPTNRAAYLGRADIGGTEGDLDALDEVWSSLMRDVRLAQSRVLVPSGTLEPNDPDASRGSGKHFDLDREVFTEIDVPQEKMLPTLIQPDIRVETHLAAAVALTRDIVSKAGYSPQTYGLDIEGRAESGVALRIRERRTFRTLGRKRRYWEQGLCDAFEALLVIDASEFASRITPARPHIVWAEEAVGAGELATTMVALHNAEAASIETRVRLVNPQWTDDMVAAEVKRIQQETGVLVPPPEF